MTKICKFKLLNKRQKRFVVVTNATQPTVAGELQPNGKVEIERVPTPMVPRYMVKTTNGAGDTLAGGMIGGLIMGMGLVQALRIGQRLVTYYIKQTDGAYPEEIF